MRTLTPDTSALVKRYVEEPGSADVDAVLRGAGALSLCVLAIPESIATMNRLVRERRLTQEQYVTLKEAILASLTGADVHGIGAETVSKAVDILERFPLRTLDALHVATALECEPDLFVSSDARQLAVAGALGLRVQAV
jgi:predicted nucleic acid-binding protein